MLALAMLGSLVAPGVVVARQNAVSVQPAPASSAALDLDAAAVEALTLAPSVSACFNNPCRTHNDCITWCNEGSARCVVQPGWVFKLCFLP
jgi:hypothetical protein